MAIPMIEIRSRFIRYDEGATLARDDNLRFMNYDNIRGYGRIIIGQVGYNAQNPIISIQTIRLNSDVVNLPRR